MHGAMQQITPVSINPCISDSIPCGGDSRTAHCRMYEYDRGAYLDEEEEVCADA